MVARVLSLPDEQGGIDAPTDVAKAKRLLGYTPLVGFDEGLALTVEHFR